MQELASNVWRTIRLPLIAPLLAVAAALTGSTPLATVCCVAAAVLLGVLGRRWTLPDASTGRLLAATVAPGCAAVFAVYLLFANARKLEVHSPAIAVFFLGLAAVLAVTARFRGARAWWIGILGAIVAADVAVILMLWPATRWAPAPF